MRFSQFTDLGSAWLRRASGVVLAGSVLLGGCASSAKPPLQTVLATTISVSPKANPDARGRPSPVVARIYELKAPTAFLGADYFSLIDKDQGTLGSDMVYLEELVLQPGETRQLNRKVSNDARLIGVVVAYRDLEKSVWRVSYDLPAPNAAGAFFKGSALNHSLRIDIGERRVSISAQ